MKIVERLRKFSHGTTRLVVEVGFTQIDGVGTVESLFAAPDPDVVRKRHKERLADISTRDTDR